DQSRPNPAGTNPTVSTPMSPPCGSGEVATSRVPPSGRLVQRAVGTGYRRVAGERDVRLRRWIRGVARAAAGERIRLAAGVQQRQVAAGGDGQPSVTARPGQIDHRGSPSPPCSSSPAGRPTPPATPP